MHSENLKIYNQQSNNGFIARPIIIGCGISGMAISKSLSKNAVDHVLIGPPPDDKPKLGESMDTPGTLDLLDNFGNYSRFYYKKDHFVFWLGKRKIKCSLQFKDNNAFVRFFKASRMKAPTSFLHVDRTGFDKALFEEVIKSKFCAYHNTLVEKVHYEKQSDTVEKVQLADGHIIPATYVFDASSYKGPIATAAELKLLELSSLQKVSFTHYYNNGTESSETEEEFQWQKDTNLILMERKTDDVDGFAWVIPLGNRISVGGSMEAKDGKNLDENALIDLIEAAFCRRGIHVKDIYPKRNKPQNFKHKYFVYEQITGKNWLIAGPSACQVWFMSGAGVGMGLYVAQLASRIIKNPKKYGKIYRNYINGLLPTHDILKGFRYDKPNEIDDDSLHSRFDQVINSNVSRTARYFFLRKRIFGSILGHITVFLAKKRLILRQYCDITEFEPLTSSNPESKLCPNCSIHVNS